MDGTELSKALSAVGALTELLDFFYEQLIDKGFTDEQALILTRDYLRLTTGK